MPALAAPVMLQWIVVILACTALCVQSTPLTDVQLNNLATSLQIRVKVLDNLRNNTVNHIVRTTLSNTGSLAIPSSGWTLYFHSMLQVFPEVFPKNKTFDLDVERVRVGMVQGDLYYMKPIDGFVAMQPGTSRDYDITVALWAVSRTDFMPYWYVTSDDDVIMPRVLPSMSSLDVDYVEPFNDLRQWKRWTNDRYNPYTAQERMRRFGFDPSGVAPMTIIPTPAKLVLTVEDLTMTLDSSWAIYNANDNFTEEADYLQELLNLYVVGSEPADKVIILRTSSVSTLPESYNLHIDPMGNKITLESSDSGGMFYAVQSLRSILDGYQKQNIPTILVEDQPRFQYRGMHLDVARNFHTVDDVKRLISAMSMYKMNKLHLHLTDDEGWRLEIPGLPELTRVGGYRCHDLSEQECIIPQFGSGPFTASSGSGYYTTAEYKELLTYAKKHHVTVIPEIDMPGHAHAAIKAMEVRYNQHFGENITEAEMYRLLDPNDTSVYISVQQWQDNAINPCINSTYRFIGKIMDEMIALHADIQPLAIYHFGGDEVANGAWLESPECKLLPEYKANKGLKVMFATRVAAMAADRNLSLAGWEDGYADANHNPIPRTHMADTDLYVNPWNSIWEWGSGSQAYKYANAGYKVILSQGTNLYFDHPQEPDPEERGLYWATRMTDTKKVLGFIPDSLYDNIKEERSGKIISKETICGKDMSKCVLLQQPQNIIGIQGALWSETVRTSEDMDFMIYPRLLALAQRAWHKSDFEAPDLTPYAKESLFEQEWQAFAVALGRKELTRLETLGVKYRIPPPGGRVLETNEIEISSTYPGLGIQYSRDGGYNWINLATDGSMSLIWQSFNQRFHIRTTNAARNRFSRAVELFKDEAPHVSCQCMVDYIADNIAVTVDVVDNLQKDEHGYVNMSVQFINIGTRDVFTDTWRIYFYSMFGVESEDLECGLTVNHVTGGLHYFTPTYKSFTGLGKGKTLLCIYRNKHWVASRYDNMPNWYVSALGMKSKVMYNTVSESLDYVGAIDRVKQWKRSEDDTYDPYTAGVRYTMNKRASNYGRPFKIMPTPTNFTFGEGVRSFLAGDEWTVILNNDFKLECQYLADKLTMELSTIRPGERYVQFVKSSTYSEEAYQVNVNTDDDIVTITAATPQGALHGVQTFIRVVDGDGGYLTAITITDEPRFQYRGVMLDVSNNFMGKEQVMKFVDVMSMYKLNKLQLLLSDDEAWRIEIPGLPELTKMASKRCQSDYSDDCLSPQLGSGPNGETSGSGFYTITDYREILEYAANRHIEVIPGVNLPGHATAAISAMEVKKEEISKMLSHGHTDVPESLDLLDGDAGSNLQNEQRFAKSTMNPCMESTYRFVEQIIDGLVEIHRPVQPLKIIHTGGQAVPDNSWPTSQACFDMPFRNSGDFLRYFVRRVDAIVAARQLKMALWDVGTYYDDHGGPVPLAEYDSSEMFVYPRDTRWETDKARRYSEFADAGYKVIVSLPTHLDLGHPQEPDPESRGVSWATRYVDTPKVFGLTPEDIYANVDVDVMGRPVNLSTICHDMACPQPTQANNIIGIQASVFSETIRTEDQLHEMAFPRLLALAERAWHKAEWENMTDAEERRTKQMEDWAEFADALGYNEMPRLERRGVHYLITPPGARVEGNKLRVSTMYPNHKVEMSNDGGATWRAYFEATLSEGVTHTFYFRTRTPILKRESRHVKMTVKLGDANNPIGEANHLKYSLVTLLFSLCILHYIR